MYRATLETTSLPRAACNGPNRSPVPSNPGRSTNVRSLPIEAFTRQVSCVVVMWQRTARLSAERGRRYPRYTSHMIPSLSAALAVILVALTAREARARCRLDGDWKVVEYPHSIRGTALTSCALVLYLTFQRDIWFGALLVPASLMALYFVRTRIRFSRREIEVRPWLRRTRMVPVSAVTRVSPGASGWTIRTEGYGKIRFNHLQRAWSELRSALENRVRGK